MFKRIKQLQLIFLCLCLAILFGATFENYKQAQIERINEISSNSYVNNESVSPKDLFLESWLLVKQSYAEPHLNDQNWYRWKRRYVNKIKDYANAKKFYDMALRCNGNVKDRKLLAISAKIYDGIGMQDSAYQENLRLWKFDNLYSRKAACRDIAKYKIKKGKGEEALDFLLKYEDCLDSINAITATETVAQMDAMFNYSAKEKEVAELKVEKANYQRMMIVAVAIIVFVFLLLIVVLLLMRTKTLSVTVNTEKRRKLNLINQLIETKEEKRKQILYELHNTDIYKTINERLKDRDVRNKRLSDDEWREIEAEICSRIRNFKQLINENCRVSEHEYRVCMLIKLGIPLSCIAEITNKSRSAISLTRRRLYERAFGKEKNAAECWDKFILSL